MPSFKTRCEEILLDHSSGSASILKQTSEAVMDALRNPRENVEGITLQLKKLFFNLPGFAIVYHFINNFSHHYEQDQNRQSLINFIENYNNKWSETPQYAASAFLSLISTNGKTILTHSNSSAIHQVVVKMRDQNQHPRFIQTRSEPGEEGLLQASKLRSLGFETLLIEDSAIGENIEKSDLALVGADLISETFFINKKGTKNIAEYLLKASKPLYVIADSRKMVQLNTLPASLKNHLLNKPAFGKYSKHSSTKDQEDIHDWFEEIPLNMVNGIITESGIIDPKANRFEINEKKVADFLIREIE